MGSTTIGNAGVTFPDATVQPTAALLNTVNAGTGISVSSTTGNPTITNTGVTSLAGSVGFGVSAATGGITINPPAPGTSGNVLTSNGTNWISSAPSGGGGSVTAVGSTIVSPYAITIPQYGSFGVGVGTSVAGGSLRYNYAFTGQTGSFAGATFSAGQNAPSYPGGGTALPGTWLCMGQANGWHNYHCDGTSDPVWTPGLWQRIA